MNTCRLCLCCTHVCVETVVHGGSHLLLNCFSGCDDVQCVYASEHCTNVNPFLKPKYASHMTYVCMYSSDNFRRLSKAHVKMK